MSADGLRVVDDKTKVRGHSLTFFGACVSPLCPCLVLPSVFALCLPHHSLGNKAKEDGLTATYSERRRDVLSASAAASLEK